MNVGLLSCTVNMLATEPSLQPWIIRYCVNVTHLSIHLLMGHLNSSHLLTIVNNTTVITKYTPISSKCCFPFIHLPRSRGTGSHSNTYLAFFFEQTLYFFFSSYRIFLYLSYSLPDYSNILANKFKFSILWLSCSS